jgi:hypothetical protein
MLNALPDRAVLCAFTAKKKERTTKTRKHRKGTPLRVPRAGTGACPYQERRITASRPGHSRFSRFDLADAGAHSPLPGAQ